jgi:hypothetical protein
VKSIDEASRWGFTPFEPIGNRFPNCYRSPR